MQFHFTAQSVKRLGYGLDVSEIVVPFPAGTRDLTLLQMRPEGLWGQRSLLFNACLVLFLSRA